MKVLFCLPRYHTNVVPWVRVLREAGHHVAIDVLDRGVTESYELLKPRLMTPSVASNVLRRLVVRDKVNPNYANFPSISGYWRHLKAEDPDLVIVRGITRPFSMVAALCAFVQGRKLAIYDQEDFAPVPWSRTWFRRAAFGLIGIPHLTVRPPTKGKKGQSGQARLLPFGALAGSSSAAEYGGRSLHWPPRVLMVGKYRRRKGHVNLLDAVALIAEQSDLHVTFCGEEGTESDTKFCEELREHAVKLGISERLSFLNNVAHSEMIEVYKRHDLFILPSSDEPAAVSPIEAAWAGCAVLMSRDSGTRAYLPYGPEYEFDPVSVEDIARAVAGVTRSLETMSRHRDACFDWIKRMGNDAVILRTFESLGRQVPIGMW